jgi:regulatory protein
MDHKITALKLQKRNRQRVNVYLDGEFAFGLSRILTAWLQVGQEISDEKIAELQAEDSLEVAYQQALKFLNYRQRSESEVRKNLESHQVSETNIENILERLKRGGLLNDQQFASTWVENRSEFHPRSKRALTFELRQRGLDQTTIEQALEEVDDEEMAYRAGLKQARKYQSLEWPDFREKLSTYLLRRGFHYEVISQVVRKIWEENGTGDNEVEQLF